MKVLSVAIAMLFVFSTHADDNDLDSQAKQAVFEIMCASDEEFKAKHGGPGGDYLYFQSMRKSYKKFLMDTENEINQLVSSNSVEYAQSLCKVVEIFAPKYETDGCKTAEGEQIDTDKAIAVCQNFTNQN